MIKINGLRRTTACHKRGGTARTLTLLAAAAVAAGGGGGVGRPAPEVEPGPGRRQRAPHGQPHRSGR
uniref:hypothetical protein n=1 Tax=Nocardia gipuzkoensis TaxID=2749991 RepID=UPI0024547E59